MAAHDGLVYWVVRQQWRGELSFDEAVQAGRIGLWHALRGYDPTIGLWCGTTGSTIPTNCLRRGDTRCLRPEPRLAT